MKAILITAYGGPDVLSVTELPDPVPAAGEVLIRVRAFGLNHAETYMRSGAWGEVAQVPGIECAGTVEADPSGRPAPGTRLAPGTPVIATTRSAERADLLRGIGAASVLIDDGALAAQVHGSGMTVDGVFDLVGNSVLRDSLGIVRPGGRVCQLGFLGGLEPVAGFDPIADLPTGVQLSFYGSAFVLGTEGFPLADIPLQEMIAKAEAGRYQAKPVRVFGFEEIVEAHRTMERGLAGGKMVVAVN